MENQSTTPPSKPARVTAKQGCLPVDGRDLMLVRHGSPVDTVMEQVMMLMDCMHALILDRDPHNRAIQTTTLQFLNEVARGMVTACYEGLDAKEGTVRS